MKGKVFALLSLIFFCGALFFFVACKPQSESTTDSVAVPVVGQASRLVDNDITVDVMMAESALVPLKNDFEFFMDLYRRTGIQINFTAVPSADYNAKKSLALSTNDMPDIIQVAQNDLNNFALEGIFVDLNAYREKLPNFFEIVERYPEAKVTFIDGIAYAFPTIARWDMIRGSSLILRKDILDKLSISPDSIKTFDDFYDALARVKAGYPEMVPYISRNGAANLMGTIGYSLGSGSGIQFDPQLNKWIYQPAREETREVLAFLKKMYDNGLLDPDYATVSGTEWQQKMAGNQGFSFLDNVNFANTNLLMLKELVPDASWSVIHMPKNSFGYSRGIFTSPHQLGRLWAISSDSQKIDDVISLFNFLYSEEACDMLNLGKEGIDFTRDVNGNAQMSEARIVRSVVNNEFIKTIDQAITGAAAWETFIPYSDNLSYFIMLPEHQVAWYNTIASDPGFTFPVSAPPFNKQERDRLAEIATNISTIATEMFDKLIMGADSLDSFNSYVERMKAAHVDELERIYNDAHARIK